jgi:hypothetical protein
MRIRVTFGRIVGASGLSLLFVLQSFARIGHASPGARIFWSGFAVVMTACSFLMVLSHRTIPERVADGEGSEQLLKSRRRRLVLWFLFIVLIGNMAVLFARW